MESLYDADQPYQMIFNENSPAGHHRPNKTVDIVAKKFLEFLIS
jgi:hypothetical protein